MFSVFILISLSSRPIFFIPGLTASPLYAVITDKSKFPNCSDFPDSRSQIWPPETSSNISRDCIADLLDTVYNNETDTISHPEGVIIDSDPATLGGRDLFLKQFDNAYTVYYDWSQYFAGLKPFMDNLKIVIETEVNKTNKKAIIMGYSLGTNFVRYFSTYFVEKDWLYQYVDGLQFIAVGVGGAFNSFVSMVTGDAFGFKAPFVHHMPAFWAMFPNFPLYKGMINDTHNKHRLIDASEAYDVLNELGYIDDVCAAIYQKVLPFISDGLPEPPLRSSLIFNTELPIECGAKSIGDGKFEYVNCGGDASIEEIGVLYACEHWKNAECHNFKLNDSRFDHFNMGNQQETADLVRQFVESFDVQTSKSGLPQNAVIGISIASVVIVVIIIIVVVILLKKKKSNTVKFEPLM